MNTKTIKRRKSSGSLLEEENVSPRVLHTGITPAAAPAVAEFLLRDDPLPVAFLLCADLKTAEFLLETFPFFMARAGKNKPAPEVLVLPPTYDSGNVESRQPDAQADRLAVLSQLKQRKNAPASGEPRLIIITTPGGLLEIPPSLEAMETREIALVEGEEVSFPGLIGQLRELDYDCESVCEAPGQYAVRGGIIDVYPVSATAPCRLDFFGNILEEIRVFDPAQQRSAEKVRSIVIPPSPSMVLPPARDGIAEYLGSAVAWVVLEPASWEKNLSLLSRPLLEKGRDSTAFYRLLQSRARHEDRWTGLCDLEISTALFDEGCPRVEWQTESLEVCRRIPAPKEFAEKRFASEQEVRNEFLRHLEDWQKTGITIVLVTHNEGEEARLQEIFAAEGFFRKESPFFCRGNLQEGFLLKNGGGRSLQWTDFPAGEGIAVVCDSEIFGRYRQRRPAGRRRKQLIRSQVDELLDFSELVEGDYLVHIQHGICRFRGLGKMQSGNQTREMISLEFDEAFLLHLPLHESHLLSRYVGLTKTRPTLGKIGSGRWEKTRKAAEKATLDFAAELLEIQAKRESRQGFAFPPDNTWQNEFDASFLFEETPDQDRAIRECKSDMERARPMDRLLCGDVGFGKTEVAIRAAFKAVLGGKQVAILVPTTVLAQQHFQSFRERMADYPVIVEMLSRFRKSAEQTEILEALKSGKIDILIGTHRLLSQDVHFKDLGVVVIDEEHRFGLKQKEKLKRLRETVDVLAMSATPIPRTLYLALTGARDLSVIDTPPVNRLPIQTIVKSYDVDLVVNAIRFEQNRGGQVFYLHNRVDTIEEVSIRLQELLPDVRIAVGHGQMTEGRLERIMADFIAGRYDVLVCTTIIESGLDIPNCNTMIVEAADRFGLSQLYQLRGRVGRSGTQAYAYLLLHRHRHVLDVARKRLAALRQHNQLGAGFKIAMRDLELRGAGNILGTRQSGHISGVGFDLYCQLLSQSIARLNGEEQARVIRASVRLDFVVLGEGEAGEKRQSEDRVLALKEEDREKTRSPALEARIPAAYITETRLRIDFYRRLAMAETPEQVKDISDQLADRFGKLPASVKALIQVTRIRCLAERKQILLVETDGNRLKCLRASGKVNDFIRVGTRFPRLTSKSSLRRLQEISGFLNRI